MKELHQAQRALQILERERAKWDTVGITIANVLARGVVDKKRPNEETFSPEEQLIASGRALDNQYQNVLFMEESIKKYIEVMKSA
jgi:hypothetical protein